MKQFDQSVNMYCWCVVGFQETSSCQNPCCSLGGGPLERSLHETCFPLSFAVDLWWLRFSTLRISGPSVLLPFPFLVISLVRGSWFWKCVSDAGGLCAGAAFPPTKGSYFFCWAGRGLWCWSLPTYIELQVGQVVSRGFVSDPGGFLPSGAWQEL